MTCLFLTWEETSCVSLTWTSCCSSSCAAWCRCPGWRQTCSKSPGSRPPPGWRRADWGWPAPGTSPHCHGRPAWRRWEVACSGWECRRDNPWSSLECCRPSHPWLWLPPLWLFLTWPAHQAAVSVSTWPGEMSECRPWLQRGLINSVRIWGEREGRARDIKYHIWPLSLSSLSSLWGGRVRTELMQQTFYLKLANRNRNLLQARQSTALTFQ